MILDVKFSDGQRVLEEAGVVLRADQAIGLDLKIKRTRLSVQIWQDEQGVVFVAGSRMNRDQTTRWRSSSLRPNQWHLAKPYTNGPGLRWKCRYRVHQEKVSRQPSTRSTQSKP